MSGDAPEGVPPFVAWLRAISAEAGVTTPQALQRLLLHQDCHCTEQSVAEWLAGTSLPSYDKMRDIIKAMNKALPDIDAWEAYRAYVEGRAELPRKPDSSEGRDEIADLVQGGGLLPPMLTD